MSRKEIKGLTEGSNGSRSERDIMGTMGAAIGLAPYASAIGIPYTPRILSRASGDQWGHKGAKGDTNRGE